VSANWQIETNAYDGDEALDVAYGVEDFLAVEGRVRLVIEAACGESFAQKTHTEREREIQGRGIRIANRYNERKEVPFLGTGSGRDGGIECVREAAQLSLERYRSASEYPIISRHRVGCMRYLEVAGSAVDLPLLRVVVRAFDGGLRRRHDAREELFDRIQR
jgi:hypothetical protein